PAACACPAAASRPDEVLFVGAFDERKGIRELLEAWPLVTDRRPAAALRVIGQGPLVDEVTARAGGLERTSVTVDPPRADIHAGLRRAAVLVLLSQPHPRWRE